MTETKRIAITGSSGFLGQHVLHTLMTQPPSPDNVIYEIFALYSSGQKFASSVVSITPHSRVTVAFDRIDLADSNSVEQWVENYKPHVILHLAAISSPAKCEDNADLARKVNCPLAFFKALSKIGAQVVAISTDQVYYGKPIDGRPFREADEVGPVNIYGKTKVEMEEALLSTLPTSSVALRSSIILGPEAPFGNAHDTFLHFCKSRGGVETDYFTDECRSVVSIRNVVFVLKFFLEHGVAAETSGVYNMGGTEIVSRYDMAIAVADRFDQHRECVKAKIKATMPPGKVQSPLNIGMDSRKLTKAVGIDFFGLKEIIQDTFPESK